MLEFKVEPLNSSMIEECANLFRDVFSKEPWNDIYDSDDLVDNYIQNFINMDSFLGFAAIYKDRIIAVSLGMKKPWINGIEYYIDQFYVSNDFQNMGIGSRFLDNINVFLQNMNINGILLNTEESFHSYDFYIKNGFKKADGLVVMYKD
ncbi:GNAT family N-acetyltransferase [Peptacetobacter hominis]|uniref:GNAT family N-acetyltransferase n=1 Tax=Peptacetobacter hominis TaxID=2743610 RepID=A0A544QWT0_9FIRM|nr:GNAT family N-acetyltransferase [Peptacetobacter hominis]TQQ85146.1 GNAT family N-acetyltransferase [Peptacetobacter hominis]